MDVLPRKTRLWAPGPRILRGWGGTGTAVCVLEGTKPAEPESHHSLFLESIEGSVFRIQIRIRDEAVPGGPHLGRKGLHIGDLAPDY